MKRKSKYWVGMEFTVNDTKLRIHSLYGSSWMEQDVVFLEVFKDGKWQDYKFVDVNNIINHLTNDR